MDEISQQVAALPELSRSELIALWRKLYRREAPEGLRREIMVPFLAYRIQEQAYGGLRPETRAELRRIARSFDSKRSAGSRNSRLRPRIKPGTHLVRQWRRKSYEVVVTETGYELNGRAYSSLSEIARQITGTRWSGPAFFGLRGKHE